MTKKKDLKKLVRRRQKDTGENYMTARKAVTPARENSINPHPRRQIIARAELPNSVRVMTDVPGTFRHLRSRH